jgi:hypothetical protein
MIPLIVNKMTSHFVFFGLSVHVHQILVHLNLEVLCKFVIVWVYMMVDSLSSLLFFDFWWCVSLLIFSLQHVGYVLYTYKDGRHTHKMECFSFRLDDTCDKTLAKVLINVLQM